jgi:hypothetical protein
MVAGNLDLREKEDTRTSKGGSGSAGRVPSARGDLSSPSRPWVRAAGCLEAVQC